MKNLMFAALAVVAAGVASADSKAYVYKVAMDINTTKGAACDSVVEIECGRSGTNALVRVADTYAIRGYIYGCHEENCGHLTDFLAAEPNTYSKARTASAAGIILWDVLHQAQIVPVDANIFNARSWKQDRELLFTERFLNRINTEFDRSEFVFDFKANVVLDADTAWETNSFNLVGAGFGVYDRTTKGGVWLSQAGNLAGTMSAPVAFDADGYAVSSRAYGMDCATAACGAAIKDTETAAYGTWSIQWDEAMVEAYTRNYADALDVPFWVLWAE